MKRFRPVTLAVGGALLLAGLTLPAAAATAAAPGKLGFYDKPLCTSGASLCADTYVNPPGGYIGHDEPSVEFKSGVRGSGNDITYTVTLPTEPSQFPNNTGDGGTTWNFQLRPTF